MKILKALFQLEKKPTKGLLAAEWASMAYLVLTLLLMFFTWTKLHNPESMLWGRVRIVAITMALWAVYRMVPCRLTRLFRVLAQLALLSWWYPDTYEFNRMFANLDHIFASYEQSLFGCQPSLLFSQAVSNPVFSELMDLGYVSYYPLITAITLFYFLWRYRDFHRAAFIILGSFFLCYIIYIFVPVAGPQYYYPAVGLDDIARGVFPDLGHYFADCQDAMPGPGYKDGVFYRMAVEAHNAGERPTAAFPSSHVGVSTIVMILAWTSRNRRLFFCMLPLYVLLCLSTVYIYAHYAIDVLGGWVVGVLFYFVLYYFHKFFFSRE